MRKKIRAYYAAWAATTPVTAPLHVGWESDRDQSLRFPVLLRLAGPLTNKLVHDAGCGVGALVPYLPPDCEYIGTEGLASNLEAARRLFPDKKFIPIDLERDALPKSDVTIVSGTFSFYSQRQVFGMIRRLYAASRERLVFNTLVGEVNAGHIAHDFAAVLEFCQSLSPRVVVTAGYLPNDASFGMTK